MWQRIVIASGFVGMIGGAAQALVIEFADPPYVDGELSGQDGGLWSGGTGGWVVGDAPANGAVTSIANPGEVVSAVFNGFTDANTGIDVDDASGVHWGQFDVTLNAGVGGRTLLATIDFGRDGNDFRVAEMNLFSDGDIEMRYNLGNVPEPQVALTLDGLLSDGVESRIKLEIDYDQLTVRLYQDDQLIDIPSDTDDVIAFADQRGAPGAAAVGSVNLINRNPSSGGITLDNIGLGVGVTPVPEPAAFTLMSLGLALIVRRP